MTNLTEMILRYLNPYLVGALLVLSIAIGGICTVVNFYYSNYIELSKEYRKNDLTILFGAVDILPDLTYAESDKAWSEAKTSFWRYYAGRLVLVENHEVCSAMAVLGQQL